MTQVLTQDHANGWEPWPPIHVGEPWPEHLDGLHGISANALVYHSAARDDLSFNRYPCPRTDALRAQHPGLSDPYQAGKLLVSRRSMYSDLTYPFGRQAQHNSHTMGTAPWSLCDFLELVHCVGCRFLSSGTSTDALHTFLTDLSSLGCMPQICVALMLTVIECPTLVMPQPNSSASQTARRTLWLVQLLSSYSPRQAFAQPTSIQRDIDSDCDPNLPWIHFDPYRRFVLRVHQRAAGVTTRRYPAPSTPATRMTATLVRDWLRTSTQWCSPLHFVGLPPESDVLSVERVRRLLPLHCPCVRGVDDGPTPLEVAAHSGRACDDPRVQLLHDALRPWSAARHVLFPAGARARAVSLLPLLYSIHALQLEHGGMDACTFAGLILAFAVTRDVF